MPETTPAYDKPKFNMTRREMLHFNDACNNAANHCPQHRNHWLIEDRRILLREISPKDLVKHWLQSDTLWRGGYHEHLTHEAREVFKDFKLYKAKKRLWKAEQAT